MPDDILSLTVHPVDEISQTQVVSFVGSLDKAGLASKHDEIQKITYDFQGKALIFDFSQLCFINSESIGFLMMIHAHLKKSDKKFFFVHVSSGVQDVFNVIGVSQLIPCVETVQDCLSLLI